MTKSIIRPPETSFSDCDPGTPKRSDYFNFSSSSALQVAV